MLEGFFSELHQELESAVIWRHGDRDDHQAALKHYFATPVPLTTNTAIILATYVWLQGSIQDQTAAASASTTEGYHYSSKREHASAVFTLMEDNFVERDIQCLVGSIFYSLLIEKNAQPKTAQIDTQGNNNQTFLGVDTVVPLYFIRTSLRDCKLDFPGLDELDGRLNEVPPGALRELCQQSPLREQLQATFDGEDKTFTTFELLISHHDHYPLLALNELADKQEARSEDFAQVARRILDTLPVSGAHAMAHARKQLRNWATLPPQQNTNAAASAKKTGKHHLFSSRDDHAEEEVAESETKKARLT